MDAPTISKTVSNVDVATKGTNRDVIAIRLMLFLCLGDLWCISFSLLLGYWLRFHSSISHLGLAFRESDFLSYGLHFYTASLTILVLLYVTGMYKTEILMRPRYGAFSILKPVVSWLFIFLFLSLGFNIEPKISRLFVLYTFVLFAISLIVWRFVYCSRYIPRAWLKSFRKHTLSIGWSAESNWLHNRTNSSKDVIFPLQLSGVLLPGRDGGEGDVPPGLPCWKDMDLLDSVLENNSFDAVIIADAELSSEQLSKIENICSRHMVELLVIPNHRNILRSHMQIETVSGIPLLIQQKLPQNQFKNQLIKRGLDIVGASVGLVLSAPIIAFFCWQVYRESPGPVFYKQLRVGKNGQTFEIIKIRSMHLDAEATTGPKWCREDDPRRLKVGAFIRKYNIDELPQFWNVLTGEMSLVGPRPERPKLIQKFKYQVQYYNIRHTVKAGMTGWAQVNGWRGDTCLNSRIVFDIEYIERWTLFFDLYILIRTLRAYKNSY